MELKWLFSSYLNHFFLSFYKLHFGYNLERPLGVLSKAVITIVFFKKILSYNSMLTIHSHYHEMDSHTNWFNTYIKSNIVLDLKLNQFYWTKELYSTDVSIAACT